MLPGFKGIFKEEKGQNILEFALLTPVLLMIFLGIFDFGWLLHKQIQLDHATRSGARRAAVGASNSEVITVVHNTCAFPVETSWITMEVQDENGAPIADSEDRTPDNYYQVSIDVPDVQFITPIKILVDSIGTVNLHSSSTFIIE